MSNSMDDNVVVNRWKRYGKDRLYVTLPIDTKVGFWDLINGEAHPESPKHLPALLAAVKGWQASQGSDPLLDLAVAVDTSGSATRNAESVLPCPSRPRPVVCVCREACGRRVP